MIATHMYKGEPVGFIAIKFRIESFHLEAATIALITRGTKPNKGIIKEEIENMLQSGGSDGATDWVHEEDFTKHIPQAMEITKKLFPTFYK